MPTALTFSMVWQQQPGQQSADEKGTECFAAVVSSISTHYGQPVTAASVLRRYDRIRNPASEAGGGGSLEISLTQHKLANCISTPARNPIPTFAQIKAQIDQGRPVAFGIGQVGRSGHLSAHALAIIGYDDAAQTVLALDPWRDAEHNQVWFTFPLTWDEPIAQRLPSGYDKAKISKVIATKSPMAKTTKPWP
jgi:hypothetical protein